MAVHSDDEELLSFINEHAGGMFAPAFIAACVRRGYEEINLSEYSSRPDGIPNATFAVRLEGDRNRDLVRTLDLGIKPKMKAFMLGQCLMKGAERLREELETTLLKDIVDDYLSSIDDGEEPEVQTEMPVRPKRKPVAQTAEEDGEVVATDTDEIEASAENEKAPDLPEPSSDDFGADYLDELDNPPQKINTGAEFLRLAASLTPPG